MIKIKDFIVRVGIRSQEELAERLGVSPSTVYSWSSGTRTPTHDMEIRLYELGMTTEELFGKAYPSSVKSEHDKLAADIADVIRKLL